MKLEGLFTGGNGELGSIHGRNEEAGLTRQKREGSAEEQCKV